MRVISAPGCHAQGYSAILPYRMTAARAMVAPVLLATGAKTKTGTGGVKQSDRFSGFASKKMASGKGPAVKSRSKAIRPHRGLIRSGTAGKVSARHVGGRRRHHLQRFRRSAGIRRGHNFGWRAVELTSAHRHGGDGVNAEEHVSTRRCRKSETAGGKDADTWVARRNYQGVLRAVRAHGTSCRAGLVIDDGNQIRGHHGRGRCRSLGVL